MSDDAGGAKASASGRLCERRVIARPRAVGAHNVPATISWVRSGRCCALIVIAGVIGTRVRGTWRSTGPAVPRPARRRLFGPAPPLVFSATRAVDRRSVLLPGSESHGGLHDRLSARPPPGQTRSRWSSCSTGSGQPHQRAAGMSPAQAVALQVDGKPLAPMAMVTVDGGGGYWNPHPGDDPMAMVIDELIPMCQHGSRPTPAADRHHGHLDGWLRRPPLGREVPRLISSGRSHQPGHLDQLQRRPRRPTPARLRLGRRLRHRRRRHPRGRAGRHPGPGRIG